MAHTPGPWKVDRVLKTMIWTEDEPYGHGSMRIADVRGWGHLTGHGACRFNEKKAVGIQDANAHLIAAAPELLAALKFFVERYTAMVASGDCGNWGVERDAEVIVARAAIAKAEGQ